MKIRLSRFLVPAVLAATIPAAAVLAQTQGQPSARAAGPSADALARLQDGRMAMIRESLKLNEAQLKLWAPVEAQMRASFTAHQQARSELRERRQQGTKAERPALPDRLDRASKRMSERAERMKSFAEAIRPLYAALTDDQKAVAGVVLRQGAGSGGRHGHRWTMHRVPREQR